MLSIAHPHSWLLQLPRDPLCSTHSPPTSLPFTSQVECKKAAHNCAKLLTGLSAVPERTTTFRPETAPEGGSVRDWLVQRLQGLHGHNLDLVEVRWGTTSMGTTLTWWR